MIRLAYDISVFLLVVGLYFQPEIRTWIQLRFKP
jgi:hypothetical protein